MSMYTDVANRVSNMVRQIEDQIGKLNSYMLKINKTRDSINYALGGSNSQDVSTMLQQLSITEDQIKVSISHLIIAKDKLLRVKMI